MARRFVISTANLTKAMENKFRNYFESTKAEWWHWLPNCWLVVAERDTECSDMVNDIASFYPIGQFFVMDVTGSGSFVGRFKEEDAPRVTAWIKANWIGMFGG